ncbi:hypothetical protein PTTG_10922, partial [Puccinia triticina 1-1 BBBD Race 1]|uniref:Uncharacterized protein n=1 Tax=Puccinia triticina (isolate 1-1 / race 1 (BBBD)) TaxID=630390 RepID=A0A0C4FCH0_PUCT1
MAHQSVISISSNSASPTDSIEILSSPLSSLSSSSSSDPPASPADSNPSPQYSLPDYEEGDASVEDQSPSSPCILEREIFGGGSPVYLPTMAVNEGSVGSDEGIPLSHMVYLLGSESGIDDTDEEMSEDRGSILMDIDANHRLPP